MEDSAILLLIHQSSKAIDTLTHKYYEPLNYEILLLVYNLVCDWNKPILRSRQSDLGHYEI